jgi:dTDP-4-amino-4,6-dideoxygalactose transaminase
MSQDLGKFIHYSRQEEANFQNAYWLSCFHVLKDTSVELISSLARAGVETRPFFPPLHIQPAFSKYKAISTSKDWNSVTISSNGICLPSGTKLSNDGQEKVCLAIHDFFTKG